MPDDFDAEIINGEPEPGALAIRPGEALTIAPLSPIMDLDTAKARLKTLQEFINFYLIEGEDYGQIPGTQKPALFKSGADKLCEIYGLTDSYDEMRSTIDWENGLFDYEIRCTLSRGARIVTVGMGSCSSFESKYRFRDAARKCPDCGKETIIKGKEQYGGGWVCHRKRGGCGAKYADEDHRILSQPTGRVANPDIVDLKNTILKMAKKRAKIDATLSATRSSGIFTQIEEEPEEEEKKPGQAAASGTAAAASPYISEPERKAVFAAAGRAHVNHDDLKKYLMERWNTDSTAKLTRPIADDLLAWLRAIELGEGRGEIGSGS